MSTQSDVTYAVKQLLETVVSRYRDNLTRASREEKVNVTAETVPGVCLLLEQTVEQSLVNDTQMLVNILSRIKD